MLMGVDCKIIYTDSRWKVPTLKRYGVNWLDFNLFQANTVCFFLAYYRAVLHSSVWRELTTGLLNSSTAPLDLLQLRSALVNEFMASVKRREFHDRTGSVNWIATCPANNSALFPPLFVFIFYCLLSIGFRIDAFCVCPLYVVNNPLY